MTIRLAVPEDIAWLLKVYTKDPAFIVPNIFRESIRDHILLVNEDQTAYLRFYKRKKDGVIIISNVFVEKSHRKNGVGTELVEALKGMFPHDPIGVRIVDGNAQAWYERLGFHFHSKVEPKGKWHKSPMEEWRFNGRD